MTTELFRQEIAEAMRAYEKYIVCINKTPEDFQASLVSLLNKAIKAYESRGPTSATASPSTSRSPYPQPERRPASAVRHLLQSALALSEAVAAQNGQAAQGTDRRRPAEVED